MVALVIESCINSDTKAYETSCMINVDEMCYSDLKRNEINKV